MYDNFNRKINYLRISVTDRCNLRCNYCQPLEAGELISHRDILRFEEIADLAQEAVKLGFYKVRITGGEPLVRRNILTLVEMLAGIDEIEDFSMTTNGTLLAKFAKQLKHAGLHRINVSLDTIDPEKYRKITQGGNLDDVLLGLKTAQEAGFSTIKVNCVVNCSKEEVDAMGVFEYCERHGFISRFIRKMDIQKGEFWPVDGGTGGQCHICNRLRVSSTGDIVPCLFGDLSFNIRRLGLRDALLQAVNAKPQEGGCSGKNEFHRIGG